VFETGGDEHPILAAVEALVAKVSDVGDVLDVEDADPVVQEDASDEVGEEECSEVADVRVAVDGRAAGVHPDGAAVARLDGFDRPGQGVPEAEGHLGILPAEPGRARHFICLAILGGRALTILRTLRYRLSEASQQ
jgi:hypothetical protein